MSSAIVQRSAEVGGSSAHRVLRDGRGKPLVEGVNFVELVIESRGTRPDGTPRIVARGEFARSDVPTENKRMYPREVWERELGKLTEAVKDRRLFGELDHPSDGKLSLQRASHIVTELKLTEDGRVVGELEVLDTQQGLNMQAILAKGGKVGVSSRGFGSVTPGSDGVQVVQDDYQLVTFDVVANPADEHAYPKFFAEDKEMGAMSEKDKKAQMEQFRTENPELVAALQEAISSEMEEKVAATVKAAVEQLRQESHDQALADLRSDPRNASAAARLSQIASIVAPHVLPEDVAAVVKEKDEQVITLTAEAKKLREALETERGLRTEAEKMAQRFGYHLHLDREMANESDEEASVIRQLVGPVAQFQSKEELDVKLKEARGAVAEQKSARMAREAKERSIREESAREVKALRDEVSVLKEERDHGLQIARQFGVRSLVEQVAARHPQGPKIRRLFDAGQINSKEDLDTVAKELDETVSPEFSRISERVRANMGRGREYLNEAAEKPSARKGGGGESLFGQPMDYLATLAGANAPVKPAGNGK